MDRVTTGVPGFDDVLRGGFLKGGLYMVMGRPGCGKTTLGNQLCFHHVKAGGKAIYATLLAESHSRMLALLDSFTFFDEEQVGSSVQYVSAYNELERSGLNALLEVLRTAVRKFGASLLVIDGVPTASAVAPSEIELKKFIHELQVIVEMLGCTCVLLTGANHPDAHYAERTMVDGLVLLSMTQFDLRMVRELEVVKHRGSRQVTGRHMYEIGSDGVEVYPRTEALGNLRRRPPPRPEGPLLPMGVEALDRMLGGGLRAGSVTLAKGPAGCGKTLLGVSFLCDGASDEKGLFFGFHEAPDRVLLKASGVGLPLAGAVDSGRVMLEWSPEHELLADYLARRLLDHVRRHEVKRVVIGGLGSFMSTLVYPSRAAAFFAALFNELRALGAATLLTMEARDVASDEPPLPVSGVSALVDSIIYLRVVEVGPHTHRLVCVAKTGDLPHDSSLRELTITSTGVHVHETSDSAGEVLRGLRRTSAPDALPAASPATSPPPPTSGSTAEGH